jgi:hypothetical protein
MNLSRLAFGYKLAITFFLANVLLGLVFTQMQLRQAIGPVDGDPTLSLTDVRYYFQGSPTGNLFVRTLDSPSHQGLLTLREEESLRAWVADGASSETYEATVAPIIEARCASCHSLEGEQADSPLTLYEDVKAYTEREDTGLSEARLVNLSYENMFLLTVLTALLTALFYLTRFQGVWKPILAFLPLCTVLLSVISWWSAKQSLLFTHVAAASGIALGALIALLAVIVLVDMWLLPEHRE